MTMSQKQHALDNLESIHDELDPRTSHILKILINADLPCREYADPSYLKNLADAVHNLWNHLCQLDTGNLEAWDMPLLELVSIYGAANGARTFRDNLQQRKTNTTQQPTECRRPRNVGCASVALIGGASCSKS